MRNRKTLLATGRYTLITKSEYVEDMIHSERGENATTKAKFAPKNQENHKEHQPKMNRQGGVNITGESEPTSLKTRVEELVNDEEVELTNNDPLLESINQCRQLFNRPIPPIETYHIYDPRLPKELNEILGAMQLTKWQLKDIENYRAPSSREVSEPI